MKGIISPMGVRGVLLSPQCRSIAKLCLNHPGHESNPIGCIDRALTLTDTLKKADVDFVHLLNMSEDDEQLFARVLRNNGIRVEVHHVN